MKKWIWLAAALATTLGTSSAFQAQDVYADQKVNGLHAKPKDSLGWSVAMDGRTLVAGMPHVDDDQVGENVGCAQVFVREGGLWQLQSTLRADQPLSKDQFGYAVAISGDTILVGAKSDWDYGRNSKGLAYVFCRVGSEWRSQGVLEAADGKTYDGFGYSVALDGDIAVVGVPGDDERARDQGSAYVFEREGDRWIQKAKLLSPHPGKDDYMGYTVTVSGETVAVGAYSADTDGVFNSGEVFVFERGNGTWPLRARLKAPDNVVGCYFGMSLAMDGDTIVVGAMYRSANTEPGTPPAKIVPQIGKAYVFVRSGSGWREQARILAPHPQAEMNFGMPAIWRDRLVLGATGETIEGKARCGAAYLYEREGGRWTLRSRLLAKDGAAGDGLGGPAISGDSIALAARDESNGAGAVYFFGNGSADLARIETVKPGLGRVVLTEPAPKDGAIISLSATGATVPSTVAVASGATEAEFPVQGGSNYELTATFGSTVARSPRNLPAAVSGPPRLEFRSLLASGWPGLVELLVRSCVLLLIGLGLARIFQRYLAFRSALWLAVNVGLVALFLPVPSFVRPPAVSNARPAVYEVTSGFSVESLRVSPFSGFDPAWLVGVFAAVALVALGAKLIATWRLVRSAEQLTDPALVNIVYETVDRLGLRDAPVVLVSDRIGSACLVGILNPCVVLPSQWLSQFGVEECRAVLVHELAHLARYDGVRLLLFSIVQSLYAWNPLARLAHRDAILVMEMRGDELAQTVLPSGNETYGKVLLSQLVSRAFASQLPGGGVLERVQRLGTERAPTPIAAYLALAAVPLGLAPAAWPQGHEFGAEAIGRDEVVLAQPADGRLFRVGPNGSGPIPLPDAFVGAKSVAVAPDGRQLAYQVERGDHSEIWLADVAARWQRVVVESPARNLYPQFSPDGKKLLFTSNDAASSRLATLDLATGVQSTIPTPDLQIVRARWHPTGKRILAIAEEEAPKPVEATRPAGKGVAEKKKPLMSAVSFDLDGKNRVVLTKKQASELTASYSPDGRKIAYLGMGTRGYGVYVVDLESRAVEYLAEVRYATDLRFSSDGRSVIVEVEAPRGSQALRVPLSGGEVEVLNPTLP